jgi:hypothetical protein
MLNIENIVKDTSIKIKTVIIPIRDLKTSANHGYHQGVWNATDELSQIACYKDILTR